MDLIITAFNQSISFSQSWLRRKKLIWFNIV